MNGGRALVAGASGLVGRNLVDHLLRQGWQVAGLARSPSPESRAAYSHFQVDLLDDAACVAALSGMEAPTHLFYCARLGARDASTEADLNARMLRNVLGPLRAAPHLHHVGLVHGTKWYGSHLGPYRTPACEDAPRAPGPNWYFDQYDLVAGWQAGSGWTFSTVRPHIVCGFATDYPYNLVTLLGAYGTICAEAGEPLTFPGSEAAFRSVSQATDVGLLSRAMAWAAITPACANQSFNVINADYFRWSNLWPRLAEFFEIRDGGVRTRPLADEAGRADALWASAQARHGLAPVRLSALANWSFADFLFRAGWDDMSSTVKLRSYGFQEVVATEPMLLGHLATLRERRIIP
jgi:nucleoside-diphosphate-sugar epimerase